MSNTAQQSGTSRLERRNSQDIDGIPDEPPPAYSTVAANSGETTLATGPSRMDFSGPPPMPDRLTANITGVGVGYEPRIHNDHNHNSFYNQGQGHGVAAQPTGGSWHGNNPFGDQNQANQQSKPDLPPRHPSQQSTGAFGGHAGPSRPPPSSAPSHNQPPNDLSPTEIPTPGRPLLRNGQMLVYPKGHFCHKCQNTGYKANDPSNPHDADWKKYGKPYTAALAASYKSSAGNNNANPSVQNAASNFQRPLPVIHSQPQHHHHYQQSHPPPPQNNYGHLPPPPGKWNTYPGQQGYQPGPHPVHPVHPPYPPHQQWGGLPHPPVAGVRYHGLPPPGALVLQPGDPRIGGMPCRNCGGSGREIGLFGFDEGKCYLCRGIGRTF